jgi:hypothetical protein
MTKDKEMTETLSEQLADYRAGLCARVPADKQTLMDQHVAHLAAMGIDRAAKQVGDRAPRHPSVLNKMQWRSHAVR